jgi:2-succinyl-5-enolpyruvyl-6-hydroxy-3-cyclohexene-1-carboxylate synthase
VSRSDRPANAGHAFGVVVADELVRHGVTDAVLAPGSRSTPLALALLADGRIRIHVRIDERSAGFLALGLARASGRPVPVLCTSGTAAAHFHAAVLEADQSRVPLLVLTADRPPELRGVGANQTIDQVKLYGDAVRWFCEVGVPESRADAPAYWRSLVSRAVAVLLGHSGGPGGPVHLNLPLREPLTPIEDDTGYPYDVAGRDGGAPWTSSARGAGVAPPALIDALTGATDGVVLVGAGLRGDEVGAVLAFAERSGWPVLAEPHSNARRGNHALGGFDALLAHAAFDAAHRPGLVLVAGRAGLSRSTLGWLTGVRHVVVDRDGSWADPTRSAEAVFRTDLTALDGVTGRARSGWLDAWVAASTAVDQAIDAVLDDDVLSEPRVARDVAGALPDGAALVVASSMPIRDLYLTMRPRGGLCVIANRGVSGIDGFVSTASGVALAHDGPTWALTGDLSLLHDVNGLVVGPGEPRPDLTLVVVNNDGGGIFSLLPQAAGDPVGFERLFGTPHSVDLAGVAAAYGVAHTPVGSPAQLAAALADQPKDLRIVEVRTERESNAVLHKRIRGAAEAALDRVTEGQGSSGS